MADVKLPKSRPVVLNDELMMLAPTPAQKADLDRALRRLHKEERFYLREFRIKVGGWLGVMRPANYWELQCYVATFGWDDERISDQPSYGPGEKWVDRW